MSNTLPIALTNLVQNNKYRKAEVRVTRTTNTYVFDTDIVRLGIYSNSLYYRGVKLWNDLPLDIRCIQDKRIFDFRLKKHIVTMAN